MAEQSGRGICDDPSGAGCEPVGRPRVVTGGTSTTGVQMRHRTPAGCSGSRRWVGAPHLESAVAWAGNWRRIPRGGVKTAGFESSTLRFKGVTTIVALHSRLAQRESSRLTRGGSGVRVPHRLLLASSTGRRSSALPQRGPGPFQRAVPPRVAERLSWRRARFKRGSTGRRRRPAQVLSPGAARQTERVASADREETRCRNRTGPQGVRGPGG